jgi:hypothetical protein
MPIRPKRENGRSVAGGQAKCNAASPAGAAKIQKSI